MVQTSGGRGDSGGRRGGGGGGIEGDDGGYDGGGDGGACNVRVKRATAVICVYPDTVSCLAQVQGLVGDMSQSQSHECPTRSISKAAVFVIGENVIDTSVHSKNVQS